MYAERVYRFKFNSLPLVLFFDKENYHDRSATCCKFADDAAAQWRCRCRQRAFQRAEAVSKIWRDIFSEKPESYPLADRVARDPEDSSAYEELRALLEKVPAQRPELLEQVQQRFIMGDMKADKGSVAAGVIQHSNVTIKNR